MATKTLFGGVRKSLVGTVLLSVGGLALSACCCDPCGPKNACYRKPCCAQQGGGMMSCGAKCGGKPAPAPQGAPAPAGGGGGQMSCGAGKCG
jgi:hypothetical protein